jgi:ComF family protein
VFWVVFDNVRTVELSTHLPTWTDPDRGRWLVSYSSPANRIELLARQAVITALDLLFPPHCVACERVGSFLCPRCLSEALPAAPRALPAFDDVRVRAGYGEPVSTAIHALKYDHQTRVAEVLGKLLAQTLHEADWPVDLVCAVPLHPKRLRERGYNQAALLAGYVAQAQNWSFVPQAVSRVRETASQVHLNAHERQANMVDAFAADPRLVAGKSVLVIDDVLTTGATLSACAEALRAAGATHLYGAAVAGSVYQEDGAGVPVTPV